MTHLARMAADTLLDAVPDYFGSRCRDPFTGVWIPTGDCGELVDELPSNLTFALGPNGVTRYEFRYEVVPAHKVMASHDEFTFEPNPHFPQEFQPRLRGRAANRAQVEGIAANLDPDALLTDFRSIDRGAPIVGPDYAVESGNGRVMAIKRAASEHPGVYERYRLALREIAPEYGITARRVDETKVPILVRVRLTEVDRQTFVNEANAAPTLAPSAIETGRQDAKHITLQMLQDLDVGPDESLEDALRASRNSSFAAALLSKLPLNERSRLVDEKGQLNQDGLRRVITATFMRAFPGDAGLTLAGRVFETLDQDVRNVIAGLGRSLGPLATLGALISSGARDAGLDISGDIAAVVPVYVRIKRTPGQTVDHYLGQAQLFGRELTPFQETVLAWMARNSRSSKEISRVLRGYAEIVIAMPPPEQTSMFPVAAEDKAQVWERALAAKPAEDREKEAPRMFQEIRHSHMGNRPADLRDDEVYVPDICGAGWWATLHSWADNIYQYGCANCGGFAVKAARALHDVVNVKLGKPVQDQANLAELADIFQAAAHGGIGQDDAVAAQDPPFTVDEVAQLVRETMEVGV